MRCRAPAAPCKADRKNLDHRDAPRQPRPKKSSSIVSPCMKDSRSRQISFAVRTGSAASARGTVSSVPTRPSCLAPTARCSHREARETPEFTAASKVA
jgi:hypothetical protein